MRNGTLFVLRIWERGEDGRDREGKQWEMDFECLPLGTGLEGGGKDGEHGREWLYITVERTTPTLSTDPY